MASVGDRDRRRPARKGFPRTRGAWRSDHACRTQAPRLGNWAASFRPAVRSKENVWVSGSFPDPGERWVVCPPPRSGLWPKRDESEQGAGAVEEGPGRPGFRPQASGLSQPPRPPPRAPGLSLPTQLSSLRGAAARNLAAGGRKARGQGPPSSPASVALGHGSMSLSCWDWPPKTEII